MQVTKVVVQSCSGRMRYSNDYYYFIIIFHTDILSHDTEVTILRSMIGKKEETNNLFEDKIRSKISFNNFGSNLYIRIEHGILL